jgi:hypothetical protein
MVHGYIFLIIAGRLFLITFLRKLRQKRKLISLYQATKLPGVPVLQSSYTSSMYMIRLIRESIERGGVRGGRGGGIPLHAMREISHHNPPNHETTYTHFPLPKRFLYFLNPTEPNPSPTLLVLLYSFTVRVIT